MRLPLNEQQPAEASATHASSKACTVCDIKSRRARSVAFYTTHLLHAPAPTASRFGSVSLATRRFSQRPASIGIPPMPNGQPAEPAVGPRRASGQRIFKRSSRPEEIRPPLSGRTWSGSGVKQIQIDDPDGWEPHRLFEPAR